MNDDNNYPANIDWGVDYALTVYHIDGSVDNYSAGHLKQFGADQYGDDEGLLFGSQEAAQERIDGVGLFDPCIYVLNSGIYVI